MRRFLQTINSVSPKILFAIFTGFIFLRTCLLPTIYDDCSYAFIWDGERGGNIGGMQLGSPEIEHRERVESFSDIFQSLASHYFTWGGRIFAHFFVQFFVWIGKPYFNVANAIIFAALVLLIIRLADTRFKLSRAALVWIFFCLLILSASSFSATIWLTGSCNYMWMSFFQLLFVLPYVQALRLNRADNSALKILLMILLGLCAGWSNEAGALATVCLTIFLVAMCKARGIFLPWTKAGLAAVIVSCACMILAPGNFARLAFQYPNFAYTVEFFLTNLTNEFTRVFLTDLTALIPLFFYFLQRNSGRLNTSEILMLAFAAAGFLVPLAMLFSPEFSPNASTASLVFILVASASAIQKLEQRNFSLSNFLPEKILRGVSIALIVGFTAYIATLICVDVYVFNENRRQLRYVQRHADLDPISLPPLNLCRGFEKIHGERTAAYFLRYFGGIDDRLDSCRNAIIAQYYGVKHLVGVKE